MVKQTFLLDPDAQAYTDDEIVGKVNAAGVAITRAAAIAGTALSSVDSDDVAEGAANKYDTGVPPSSTDELSEGATNKYDTGVPPADLEALPDGATRKAMLDAEKTKLTGIAAGAEVNVGEEFTTGEQTKLAGIDEGAKVDQTGPEVRDLIVGLSDVDRKIVITEPIAGEFPIISVQRDADGKTKVSYDDVPVT